MSFVFKSATTKAAALIAFPSITYFSPEGGDYRISAYLSTSTSENSGEIFANIQWSDEFRPSATNLIQLTHVPYNGFDSETGFGGFTEETHVVHVSQGTSISINIQGDEIPEGSSASLYITIEKLVGKL